MNILASTWSMSTPCGSAVGACTPISLSHRSCSLACPPCSSSSVLLLCCWTLLLLLALAWGFVGSSTCVVSVRSRTGSLERAYMARVCSLC